MLMWSHLTAANKSKIFPILILDFNYFASELKHEHAVDDPEMVAAMVDMWVIFLLSR